MKETEGVRFVREGGLAMRALKNKSILAALTLVTGISVAGCNIDGRRTRLRSADPAVANYVEPATLSQDSDVPEVDLVESVLSHRTQYRRNLHRLYEYYRRHGDTTKADWAAFELKGLKTVKQFRYFLDAEIPPKDLEATEPVPEADAMLDEGLELMRKGGHGIPAFYREDRMVEAADTLRRLVELHPNSDKIDDAAFYLGEIHREYFPGQELLAAQWYERATDWNPATPHPARFHAAVIYDEYLRDRAHALELYHGVLEHDTDAGHARHATKRIHYLSDARWNSMPRQTHASPR